MHGLETLDWVVVALYFLAVFGVAFGAAWRQKAGRETSAGYFLAGRNVGWFVIGASLFASNIGSEHLVGLAGAGASSGVVLGQYEVQASLILLILGWVFVPFYLKTGVFTMPEFLERRYSPSARWYLAVVSIVGYVLTKISVTIAAGGIVFTSLMGLNFWTGAIIVVVATGVYTIFGGLRAVLYTDLFQAFVLIAGSAAVLFIGLEKLGGWESMASTAGSDMLSMWKPVTDPNFPWTGILFGAPIVAVWYWCTDQFIVQRVLSARNIDQARQGTLFAGFLKQLPLFLFVIPGVVAYSLAKRGDLVLEKPDAALPTLIGVLLPVGFRGLVVAGLLAALMSSLSSVFNSCSTLVTIDIYKKLVPRASERRLVLVGQISTAVLVGLGLAWIPFMKYISGQLYEYLQSVQAYISPPIAAVFLIGVFWKRVNARGAIVSLIAGFLLGMGRLFLELRKDSLGAGLLYDYATINFMHMAILLFVVCSALLIIVSLMTRSESEEKLAGLTFQTVGPAGVEVVSAREARSWRFWMQILLSLVIVGIVVVVWLYFRP
jgi:SSS family solute:Na+ symporter